MASAPVLTLRPGRERSLLRRHPWVFSGAVARIPHDLESGELVRVHSAEGRFLAWAWASPTSQIVARVVSFDEDEVVDDDFLTARIRASAARRADLAGRTDSARLVFSESDGVPGVIADRYGDWVAVELTTAGADVNRAVIGAALLDLPGVKGVYERSDIDVRKREGLPLRRELLAGEEPPEHVIIREDGVRYAVDIRRGHKTGFYLDQRESRRTVARLAEGRHVLNTFCYTGAFSVVASLAGARDVVSVDSSGPALELAARNLSLNGCPPGELVEADVFSELRRRRGLGEVFGLVVLDPPKLAHRTDQVDKATRAYKDLNLQAFHLLGPGGHLVTFSCSGLVDEELFQKVVAGAALDAGREARIVGKLHQASDHPVLLSMPESAYLKGLVIEVA